MQLRTACELDIPMKLPLSEEAVQPPRVSATGYGYAYGFPIFFIKDSTLGRLSGISGNLITISQED